MMTGSMWRVWAGVRVSALKSARDKKKGKNCDAKLGYKSISH